MKTPNTSNIKHCNKCEVYIHLRKSNKRKTGRQLLSKPLTPAQGCVWPEPVPAAQRTRSEATGDRTPFHPGAHALSPTLRWRRHSHANSPNVHTPGMLEETGTPGRNPGRHGEKRPTPHGRWTSLQSILLPHHVIRKWTWENDTICGAPVQTFNSL